MSVTFNATIRLEELRVSEAWLRSGDEPMISLDHPGGSWITITESELPELDTLIGKLQLARERLVTAAAHRPGGTQ
jgi:hypothetical protein